MRVGLLTTDTTHHTFWAARLAERFPIAAVVLETGATPPPFGVGHAFEDERDAYEREVLLAGIDVGLGDLAPTIAVDRIDEAEPALRDLALDVAIVFGTRRIGPALIGAPRVACLNLHGGDPRCYRGLDSHLWAVYHRDFAGLVTALHEVEPELDTGAIVGLEPVLVTPGMPLAHLRAANTRTCLALCVAALETLTAGVELPAQPQERRGRYYGAMPAVLKDVCVRSFASHTAAL